MQSHTAIRSTLGFLATLLLAACGGGGGDGSTNPPPVEGTRLTIDAGLLPPAGVVSHPYPGFTLSASGGSAPLTWSVTAGALPPGLTLDSNGSLSGTPSTAGSSTFTATVKDSAPTPQPSSQSFTVVVNNPGPPVINALPSPLVGTVGTLFGASFSASDGLLPLTWSLTAGALPPGLTLDAFGTLSGTPTSTGSFTFALTVTDSGAAPAMATGEFTVVIENPPPPTVNNRLLPTGTVGTAYPGGIQFSAINGLAPFVWSETGALPGLGLSLDGVLSGTPTSAGRFPITVNVTDAISQTAVGLPVTVRVSLARPAAGFTLTGSMTIARSGHTATLLPDGKVLVAGGPNESAELYDPESGTFSATGSMIVARSGHTATLLTNAALPNRGKVLIVGGNSTVTTAELYDPTNGTFTATGSAIGVLSGHTATLLGNGKVLIVAGRSTTAAELYDPASGTFTATGDLTFARTGHTATLLLDGRVLIAAGGTNAAELYDPATGTFTATGSMFRVRSEGAMATRLADGTVLIAGSAGFDGADSAAELFDPVAGTFALVGDLLSGVVDATASLRNDGTVLVAGGAPWKRYYGSCNYPAECRVRYGGLFRYVRVSTTLAQSFAPESEGYTATGSLNAARNGHTATVLADGNTVLITGGTQYTVFRINGFSSAKHITLSSAELYR
jgi:hypothetical protein